MAEHLEKEIFKKVNENASTMQKTFLAWKRG